MRIAVVVLLLVLIASMAHGQTCTSIIDGRTIGLSDGRAVIIRGVDAQDESVAKRRLHLWILDRPVTLSDVQVGEWGVVTANVEWRGYDIGRQLAASMARLSKPATSSRATQQAVISPTVVSPSVPVYYSPRIYSRPAVTYQQPVYRYIRPTIRYSSACPGGVCQ